MIVGAGERQRVDFPTRIERNENAATSIRAGRVDQRPVTRDRKLSGAGFGFLTNPIEDRDRGTENLPVLRVEWQSHQYAADSRQVNDVPRIHVDRVCPENQLRDVAGITEGESGSGDSVRQSRLDGAQCK